MSEINEIYYEGYEGEPEIIFIIENNGIKRKMLGIWDGFLNDILSDVKPTDKGWVGIAYYWHIGMFEDEHWLRDKPWRIDDLSSVYKQLTSINHDMRAFRYYDTLAVLCNIIDLIKEAMENNEEVLIYRD
ncbi:hypothetical protein [Ruminococcus sp.]|uniref:hypothetical protein n=1 Tax=Ruminococcus sp. TaxID=41978 RepID=UPI0025F237EC|nr:hypothetical protein [Ruminococcus sp.]MBR1431609.1 hypothetical protein [Ruminococcus sp.]